MKDLHEHETDGSYGGEFTVDNRILLVRLEVSRDCEAELAVLLKGAARRGFIRLDRILPFLQPEAQCPRPKMKT